MAEEAEELFRGGLLSPEPSASASSVKNNEISLPSETSRQGNDGDSEEAAIEDHNEKESSSANNQSETHHLPQAPTIEPTRRPPQPKREPCSSQAAVVVPRSAKTTPRGTSSQTPFKKPSSTATMKLSRTPSSRSIVSSRSNASSSTPTTAVPVTINILALSDRDNHPYQSLKPKHTCTLKVMPHTKVKEICLHTAEHMSRKFNVFLDGSRFEVRDQEGYLFSRGEMISEEVLDGDPLYLIEDAVSEKGKQKERDDLSQLQVLEKSARKGSRRTGPYRTPSLSSRTSSSARKWSRVAKSEPKKATTNAQTVLELAQTRSAPRPANQTLTSGGQLLQPEPTAEPVDSKTSASPAKDLTVVPFAASTTPRRKWTVRRETSAEQQETDKSALVEVVASQQSLPSPESSPAPEDDTRLVIPDSQQDSASPSPSPKKNPVQGQLAPPPIPPKPEPKNALQPPKAQPCSAPPTKTVDTSSSVVSSVAPPTSLPSRPDPYDISTVLSDDDNYSPRPQKTSMSSFARKLGSSRKRAPAAAPPAAQRPALSSTRPSSPIKDKPPPAINQTVIASTPARPALTPKRAEPSSPAGPLPSSPTNYVAAVIAKDRAQKKRALQNEAVVIYDSSDDVDENLLQEAPQRFSSPKQSQPSEPLAHWTRPPKLQLSQGLDPFWAVRPVGRRPAISKTENDDDTKSQMRRLGELGGSQATRTGSGQLRPRAQSPSATLPSKASLSETSPPKKQSTVFPGRYPLGFPSTSPSKGASKTDVGKSPAIEIHSSSSELADQVDGGIANKGSSTPGQASSPSKKTEPIVISDTSSQYESEEEEQGVPSKTGFVPAAERSSPPEDLPLAEELPVEHPAGLPDEEEPELPNLRQETPLLSTAPEGLAQSQSKADTFVELPQTDPFVENQNEESPPSAQPSKRMREPSDEPDTEEERKKRARRADKKARKLQRHEEKKAHEEQKPALSEEHKMLAAEEAWHRAQELVVALSSPSKTADWDAEASNGYESSEESDAEGDQNTATPKFPSLTEPDKFEEDDNDDSLSSKETEGRSSWRELSKRHFSESPKCSQKHGQQGAPKPNGTPVVKPRYQREIYDDWAFLEAHLGRSYEMMDVHNRIHMQMLHQDTRQAMATGLEQVTEPAAEETSKATIRPDVTVQTKMKEKDSKRKELRDPRGAQDPEGGAVNTSHATRSAVPSKAGSQEKKEQETPNKAKNSKKMTQKRREKTISRKKRWRRGKTKAHFKGIRGALVEKRC